MNIYLSNKRVIAMALLFSFTFFSILSNPAYATLVTTDQVMASSEGAYAKEKIKIFLAREDVANQLASWGVDHQTALSRVDRLTEQEVINLSERIDKMPAGGDAISTFFVLALFIFVVLLITDISGFTDIFPFVKKSTPPRN